MADIPYNLLTKDFANYGDGLNGTLKMPIPSSISDVNELPAEWGTNLGNLIGRAKGFGGIGTIVKGGTVEISFPGTFSFLPIVKIKLLAPEGYDNFDRVYLHRQDNTGRSKIGEINVFDNRDAVWQGVRIVHDAWERRESPLQMSVWTTRFWMSHSYAERIHPNLDSSPQIIWDARYYDLVFMWHAIGV